MTFINLSRGEDLLLYETEIAKIRSNTKTAARNRNQFFANIYGDF